MSPDQYLLSILAREAVDTSVSSPVRLALRALQPIIQEWAGRYLSSLSPSGSFAKRTANKSGTDIDLFISLSHTTPNTLKEIYENLFRYMQAQGFSPRKQNVSINVRLDGQDIDLVPARRQDPSGQDHSLYRRRADTWTKTNVQAHIDHVVRAGRQAPTRILKLWRNQRGLDFPSFYLELVVIHALDVQQGFSVSAQAADVLRYLAGDFPNARFVDPANTNNIVSDDLDTAQKAQIKLAAATALQSSWPQVVR